MIWNHTTLHDTMWCTGEGDNIHIKRCFVRGDEEEISDLVEGIDTLPASFPPFLFWLAILSFPLFNSLCIPLTLPPFLLPSLPLTLPPTLLLTLTPFPPLVFSFFLPLILPPSFYPPSHPCAPCLPPSNPLYLPPPITLLQSGERLSPYFC